MPLQTEQLKKTEQFKSDYKAKLSQEGYTNLLDDENIDAVYTALPHQHHYEWITKALNAGKHVLCEKLLNMDQGQMYSWFGSI